MRKYTTLFVVLCCAVWVTNVTYGQEWSAEQKEVWKNVETYWKLGTDKDLAGWATYVHEDFLGWQRGDLVPTNKNDRVAIAKGLNSSSDTLWHHVKPVGILIHGDIAIVHYTYWLSFKNAEGETVNEKGYWTDILKKDGGRWIMVADAGGALPEDD